MRGVPIADIIDIDEAFFFWSIRIEGMGRHHPVYAVVRMVCMEEGRR